MLKVEHLTKKYGTKTALCDVSFTVKKGSICGFLGPNGAGKSTVMNIISGYIGADEGTVTIDGINMFENPKAAKTKIGYLPETPPLYQDMTAREYLTFAAKIKGIEKSKIANEVASLIKKTGLSGNDDRMIRFLSKGYRQRIGLACALLGAPPLIILDEPTVGLDPKQINEIRTLICSLKNKHTVLISSHILSEISTMCDDILILSQGRLVANDKQEALAKAASDKKAFYVAAKCDRKQLLQVLKTVDCITDIKCKSDENKTSCAVFAQKGKKDPRPAAVAAVSAAGLDILEIRECEYSLEQAFLKLTETDGQAEKEEGEKQ